MEITITNKGVLENVLNKYNSFPLGGNKLILSSDGTCKVFYNDGRIITCKWWYVGKGEFYISHKRKKEPVKWILSFYKDVLSLVHFMNTPKDVPVLDGILRVHLKMPTGNRIKIFDFLLKKGFNLDKSYQFNLLSLKINFNDKTVECHKGYQEYNKVGYSRLKHVIEHYL